MRVFVFPILCTVAFLCLLCSASDDLQPSSETKLCESEVKTIYPEKAVSTNGISYFIINTETGIQVETCKNAGSECEVQGTLSPGYSSQCTQQYKLVKLLTFDSNYNIGLFDFEFPAGCSCKLVRSTQ